MQVKLTTIKPSKQLILLLLFVYCLAALAILLSGIAWYFKGLWLAILFKVAKRQLKQHFFLSDSRSIVALAKQQDFWLLTLPTHERVPAELKQNSLITYSLMVLNFKTYELGGLTTIFTPGMVGFQEYRRMMVYFRHGK
jgi:hypothetical protein